MAKYVPSPRDWVREQVALYENSGGTKGTTLRDTGLPVVIVTHWGNKTGAIRKAREPKWAVVARREPDVGRFGAALSSLTATATKCS
jgi:F420H(2)-dependent quinone reductase